MGSARRVSAPAPARRRRASPHLLVDAVVLLAQDLVPLLLDADVLVAVVLRGAGEGGRAAPLSAPGPPVPPGEGGAGQEAGAHPLALLAHVDAHVGELVAQVLVLLLGRDDRLPVLLDGPLRGGGGGPV